MNNEKNYIMTLDNNKQYAITGMVMFNEKNMLI